MKSPGHRDWQPLPPKRSYDRWSDDEATKARSRIAALPPSERVDALARELASTTDGKVSSALRAETMALLATGHVDEHLAVLRRLAETEDPRSGLFRTDILYALLDVPDAAYGISFLRKLHAELATTTLPHFTRCSEAIVRLLLGDHPEELARYTTDDAEDVHARFKANAEAFRDEAQRIADSPGCPFLALTRSTQALRAKRFKEAAELAATGFESFPFEDELARTFVHAAALLGRHDEVIAWLERLGTGIFRVADDKTLIDAEAAGNAIAVYAMRRPREGVERFASLVGSLDWQREPNTILVANFACLFALAGDAARAAEYARHTVSRGDPQFGKSYFRTDADFAAVRDAPEFRQFLEEP
ncbi:MAG TPA: hypothetical protein VGH28_00675 [Polyangiaceae bacterium]|jgi:hypothetical protein